MVFKVTMDLTPDQLALVDAILSGTYRPKRMCSLVYSNGTTSEYQEDGNPFKITPCDLEGPVKAITFLADGWEIGTVYADPSDEPDENPVQDDSVRRGLPAVPAGPGDRREARP